MDRGCGIDARKTERISRASGRDEHEINGNVRRNMELEAGEGSRWAKSIEGGALGRRGERTEGRERRKRECRVEHTRMEWSVYGCARTHVVGVACCRRRRCRSSLPTQLLDALRQPSRHDLSAFSTTTRLSLLHALCPLSPAFVRRSRRRQRRWRWCRHRAASRHPLFCTLLRPHRARVYYTAAYTHACTLATIFTHASSWLENRGTERKRERG